MRTWALVGLLTTDSRWRDPNPGRDRVTAIEHALQTAARAERHDPADAEGITVALLHDAARPLSEARHGEVMAEILRDRIGDEWYQALYHHGCFQHALLRGRVLVECISSPGWGEPVWHQESDSWYGHAQRLAAWDAASFDPTYVTPPLEDFLPWMREVLQEFS